MIVIGSTALKTHFPDFNREPKDKDFITFEFTDYNQFKELNQPLDKSLKIEYLKNKVISDRYYNKEEFQKNPFKEYIISPNDLYTLKMSHMFWNVNWEKHMFDIQFLKSKGCKLDLELFHKLYKYWPEIHGKNTRSDLKMSAEDFFDNALVYDYKHDDLHTLLKKEPTYTKVLIGEVEVGEDKFNQLSFEEKCDLVIEEVMVMAWERYKKLDYKKAYSRMLKKFIVSHAPLWESIFIIENYIHLHKPKFNYFKQIEDNLNLLNKINQ